MIFPWQTGETLKDKLNWVAADLRHQRVLVWEKLKIEPKIRMMQAKKFPKDKYNNSENNNKNISNNEKNSLSQYGVSFLIK